MLVGAAAELVVLVVWSPPKGLLDGCAPKMEPPPPKLGAGAVPLVAELDELKGLFPAEKLKPDEGGWGLKVELWLPAPKAGNDEVVKELLGVEDCAGGKLLVAAPPNMGAPPIGAEAPKLKPPDCCGAPKFALCERFCVMTSVRCCCACTRRIARRPAALYLLGIAGAAIADADVDAVEGGAREWVWANTHGRGCASCTSCTARFDALDSGGASQYNRKTRGESGSKRQALDRPGRGRGEGEGEGGRTCATPTAQQSRAGEPRPAHRAPRRGSRACLVQTNWRVCRTWLEGWVGWMRRRLAMKECDGKWSKTHRDARPSARSPPARWLACALSSLLSKSESRR
jgi:hypothetical protein